MHKFMGTKKSIKYMLISTFAFACMNVTVKYLDNVSAYQIVFFRSISSLFYTFLNTKKLLVLREIGWCYFYNIIFYVYRILAHRYFIFIALYSSSKVLRSYIYIIVRRFTFSKIYIVFS